MRVAGLFEQIQRARNVGVNEILASVCANVRLVERRGMYNGIHSAQTLSDHGAVTD